MNLLNRFRAELGRIGRSCFSACGLLVKSLPPAKGSGVQARASTPAGEARHGLLEHQGALGLDDGPGRACPRLQAALAQPIAGRSKSTTAAAATSEARPPGPAGTSFGSAGVSP